MYEPTFMEIVRWLVTLFNDLEPTLQVPFNELDDVASFNGLPRKLVETAKAVMLRLAAKSLRGQMSSISSTSRCATGWAITVILGTFGGEIQRSDSEDLATLELVLRQDPHQLRVIYDHLGMVEALALYDDPLLSRAYGRRRGETLESSRVRALSPHGENKYLSRDAATIVNAILARVKRDPACVWGSVVWNAVGYALDVMFPIPRTGDAALLRRELEHSSRPTNPAAIETFRTRLLAADDGEDIARAAFATGHAELIAAYGELLPDPIVHYLATPMVRWSSIGTA